MIFARKVAMFTRSWNLGSHLRFVGFLLATLGVSANPPLLTLRDSDIPGKKSFDFEGVLQSSTDLVTWIDLEPQPVSPWTIETETEARFFRARAFDAQEAADPRNLPRLKISDLQYQGAFRLSQGTFGDSSLNYSQGPIAYHATRHSLFIVGHAHHQAIAEFAIPGLVVSDKVEDLNRVEQPLQAFSTVLNRTSDGNPQSMNRVGGLYVTDGKLIVNVYEYYDAPGDNTHTTLVIEDVDNIADSSIQGYFSMSGLAHASGWISEIPSEWQILFGNSHLTGFSSGIPIIGRTSVGPAAFGFDPDSIGLAGTMINTEAFQNFSLQNRLHEDLSNSDLDNDLWTHLSAATYGFIVPGTRTYLTVGSSGGHDSGVGYKITQDNGNLCGGYCSYESADNSSYYWLWDTLDWLRVKEGELEAHEVRPYAFGPFPNPLDNGRMNAIGGGAYDTENGLLYLSLQRADNQAGTYSNPPIIAAYAFLTDQ